MSKITKVFKKIIPKKKKVAAAVVKAAPVASGVVKAGLDLAAAGRKRSTTRLRRNAGLGTPDDAAIIRPGARSAKLLGE